VSLKARPTAPSKPNSFEASRPPPRLDFNAEAGKAANPAGVAWWDRTLSMFSQAAMVTLEKRAAAGAAALEG
jgi:hypothetical protein